MKFYNGKEINRENLLEMIEECIQGNWKNSDIERNAEVAMEIIAREEYEGRDEDIEYILEKLKYEHSPNLQDVERIISQGDWYFQETEIYQNTITNI